MMSENVDDLLSVFNSSSGSNPIAKNNLLTPVVHHHTEYEAGILPRSIDGPARQSARDFLNVFLCVPTINSKRVQFHQLAAIVLVDAILLAIFRLVQFFSS